jgi:hypothetical protein
MADGKVTVYVLLDFTKAFDLITHGLFIHGLGSRYDCHTSAMSMVSSGFSPRSLSSGCSTRMYPISVVFFYVYQ